MIQTDVLMQRLENGLEILKNESPGITWEDLNMTQESLRIILKAHFEDRITEDEAATLIEDLYNNNYPGINTSNYPEYWPQAVYNSEEIPKYEVTCSKTE